ncbi:hypothetical protein GGTG_00744 [Gaeumannomyces tritici R3-111a-1]|uniref:Uncharacterized protein n=1 Tax=Gaeumannomyces tritici (strain R3-111a-1) TaxID=644352 RepID=J3NHK7_GAET3|nr:hypothetical protein GGTG_00744 [Gaeumannomyces tritici R3-111a-1]EJT80750.1 hypothetical protein GGTG_00744 [Gaeumannomyces tritici R3-111a-1]
MHSQGDGNWAGQNSREYLVKKLSDFPIVAFFRDFFQFDPVQQISLLPTPSEAELC